MILDHLYACSHICMTIFAHLVHLAQTAAANTATPAAATAASVSAFAAKRQSLALTAGEQRDTLMIRATECNVLVRLFVVSLYASLFCISF
jgi:hypothetical protein